MARLGEICDIVNGYAFKSDEYVESGIRIIRISNVQKGYIEDATPVYYPGDNPFAKKYALQENDLLLSLTGNVGRVALLDKEYLPAALNQRVACLRPKQNINVDKQFLFHLLNSDAFEQRCIQSSKGVAQKNMSTEWLKEYPIPVPPIEKQREICATLDLANKMISLRKKQLQKLDDLVKSRFVEMFKAESPSNCSKCIHDFAEVFSGFAFSSEDFCENAVPVIRISNINDGKVFPDHSICFPIDFWEKNERYRVLQGDILMAMSGATTGKAGISTYSGPLLLNQRVACIRAKKEVSTREFLFVATQLPWMYDLIQEASAGCAQPNISGKQIERLPIPEAKHEEQKAFSIFVNQIEDLKLTVQQGLDKLELLKQSLMQKYFG